jgi:phosphohistidine swiveling domain-containing protein
VFTAQEAVQAEQDGRDVILVRPFTEADDVAGFHAAKGIVTSEGGKASHAALVARGMGVPAVTGASDLEIDVSAGEVRIDATTLHAGDRLAGPGKRCPVEIVVSADRMMFRVRAVNAINTVRKRIFMATLCSLGIAQMRLGVVMRRVSAGRGSPCSCSAPLGL